MSELYMVGNLLPRTYLVYSNFFNVTGIKLLLKQINYRKNSVQKSQSSAWSCF